MVLSASEDGTVREIDLRVRPLPLPRSSGEPGWDDANVLGERARLGRGGGRGGKGWRRPRWLWVLFQEQQSLAALGLRHGAEQRVLSKNPAPPRPAVDQRSERLGRGRMRVGIYSAALDERRPWLLLTGGTDPAARLYDRRMLPPPPEPQHGTGGRGRRPQWLACYVPAHIRTALGEARPGSAGAGAAAAPGPGPYQVSAVAFARGGAEVVASYSADFIYRRGGETPTAAAAPGPCWPPNLLAMQGNCSLPPPCPPTQL